MRNAYNILFITCALLFATSCINEKYAEGVCKARKVSEDTRIMLRLKISGNFNDTRSVMDTAKESKIEDVYVLIFDTTTDGKLIAVRRGDNITQTVINKAEFVVVVPVEEDNDDDYRIVVMANCKEIIEDKLPEHINVDIITGTHKYNDVMKDLYGEVTEKMFSHIDKMPMWGETIDKLTVDSVIDDIKLLRSIARVDVGVGAKPESNPGFEYRSWNGRDEDDNPIPFKLEAVYIVRPNTKYRLAAHPSNISSDNKAVRPSIDGSTGTNADAGQLSILNPEELTDYMFWGEVNDELYTIQDIYVPEAIVNFGGQGVSGDANHTNRPAIVVGGVYDDGSNRTSYYRIDFMDANKNLKDVLRNHLYRFSIAGVTGQGYDTVKEAYEGNVVNIVIGAVSVHDWGESENVVIPF